MTDHEMRVKLDEAMGWTDLGPVSPCIRPHCLWGTEPAGWFAPGSRARAGIIAPDPLESDADAARLRAWLIADYWEVRIVASRHDATAIVWREHDHRRHVETVHPATDPDPCCRDRLALCRAVVQALDAVDAGGDP